MATSCARFFRSASSLAIAAVLAIAATTASAGDWTGYMNVFANASGSQGAYIFGSGWGVSDLKTTISNSSAGTIIGDQLVLSPTSTPTRTRWAVAMRTVPFGRTARTVAQRPARLATSG